jgi:hypothetical protein
MTSTLDQKAHWGLGEVVMWIRTHDYERLSAISELTRIRHCPALSRLLFFRSICSRSY